MSINRVTLTGELAKDPELRSTKGGLLILGFTLIVKDRVQNAKTGKWEDYSNFVKCSMFGSRSEFFKKMLHKGTQATIEGKLRWTQWERDGKKLSNLEVIVEALEFHTPEPVKRAE